jgi:hypothetical protein
MNKIMVLQRLPASLLASCSAMPFDNSDNENENENAQRMMMMILTTVYAFTMNSLF